MSWTELPQNGDGPGSRSSHTLTYLDGALWCLGGEREPRVPVDDALFKYDLKTESWTKVAVNGTPPSPRISPTAAAVGGLLWVFGGRTGVEMGEGSLGDLYVFDTRTSAWSLVDSGGSGATPQARSYHAMTSVGTDLYVFGGCGEGGRLNDLHRYDTAARTWQALPVSSTIAGRGGSCLTATADGKSLLVVAGFCGHELSDLHRFDLAAGSWDCPSCCNSNAGLPSRSVFGTAVHRCGGGCSHADHIVAFGGEIDPSDKGHAGAGDFTDEAFCLHAGHGWHKLEAGGTRKPCPRGWFASAALPDGRMVVHGGLDNANERLGDMFALSLHD